MPTTKLTPADWLKKYYPIPAEKSKKGEAAAHSLRKWLGLRPAVLKKYGLAFNHGSKKVWSLVTEETVLIIDSSSCALCYHFLPDTRCESDEACSKCPLAKVRGGHSCTTPFGAEGLYSPYDRLLDFFDPEPMLRWLRKAVALQKKESKK